MNSYLESINSLSTEALEELFIGLEGAVEEGVSGAIQRSHLVREEMRRRALGLSVHFSRLPDELNNHAS